MKSKISCLLIICFLPLFAFAKDIKHEAAKEFDICMKETKKQRDQCNFGGCGNIIGSCYERQIYKISSATDYLEKKLKVQRCVQAANQASNEIENLNSKLKLLGPFEDTWSGYDVQVEVALLKNNVVNALMKECEAKN